MKRFHIQKQLLNDYVMHYYQVYALINKSNGEKYSILPQQNQQHWADHSFHPLPKPTIYQVYPQLHGNQ